MAGKSNKINLLKNAKNIKSYSWKNFLWYLIIVLTCNLFFIVKIKIFIIFLLGLTLWISHSIYLHNLFENVRFFSHLADFEREMTYRTEMASFYLQLNLFIKIFKIWSKQKVTNLY